MFKKYSSLFLILVFSYQILSAAPCKTASLDKRLQVSIPSEYLYNPAVDPETWKELEPYFLPYNHPIRPVLDAIFQSGRPTACHDSFFAAGFQAKLRENPEHLLVGRHPYLNGFLVKAFLDTHKACEWENFLERVIGAQSVAKCIQAHGFQKLFKVPKKWIYPLPLDSCPGTASTKNFVLIVEDMHILEKNTNTRHFKTKMTPEILDALYIIISEEGLYDSVAKCNIPFNKSGQINFVDTEVHHHWPIDYSRLSRYLSPTMQTHWQNIYEGRAN